MTTLDAVLLVVTILAMVWALSERALRDSQIQDTKEAREDTEFWRVEYDKAAKDRDSWRACALELEADRKTMLKRGGA